MEAPPDGEPINPQPCERPGCCPSGYSLSVPVRPFDPEKEVRLRRVLEPLVKSRPGTWFFVNIGPRIDPPLMRATRGRIRLGLIAPTVLVTHKGRRSGKKRTTPLVYFSQGESVVLIASKGGAPHHPDWYHNLKANPRVEASSDGRPVPYIAREAEGEERDRLFALATKLYSGYADYQVRAADRRIPVMVLDPA